MKKMFIIIFIVTILFQFVPAVDVHLMHNRAFEQSINSSLECIRNEMEQGFPELGLPQFNPLHINDEKIDLNVANIEGISGIIEIVEAEVAGLTGWNVTTLKGVIAFIPPSYKVTGSINFPKIIINAKYKANVAFGTFNTWSEGTLDLEAIDVAFTVDFKVNIAKKLNLQYLKLNPSLNKFDKFVVTGILGDENLSSELSEYIYANGSQLVSLAAPTITKTVEDFMINFVNNNNTEHEENVLLQKLLKKCLHLKHVSVNEN